MPCCWIQKQSWCTNKGGNLIDTCSLSQHFCSFPKFSFLTQTQSQIAQCYSTKQTDSQSVLREMHNMSSPMEDNIIKLTSSSYTHKLSHSFIQCTVTDHALQYYWDNTATHTNGKLNLHEGSQLTNTNTILPNNSRENFSLPGVLMDTYVSAILHLQLLFHILLVTSLSSTLFYEGWLPHRIALYPTILAAHIIPQDTPLLR